MAGDYGPVWRYGHPGFSAMLAAPGQQVLCIPVRAVTALFTVACSLDWTDVDGSWSYSQLRGLALKEAILAFRFSFLFFSFLTSPLSAARQKDVSQNFLWHL